jgi:dienelactone hydrolase
LNIPDSNEYQVFIPDFLDGASPDPAWFPMDTAEKGAKLGEFLQGPANQERAAGRIGPVLKEIMEKSNGTITKWAALGMCWGGKVRHLPLILALSLNSH